MIRLSFALLFASGALAGESTKLPEFSVAALAFPTASNAQVSPMAKADSGQVWVTWGATTAGGTMLYASWLSAATPQWSTPVRVGKAPAPLEGAPSIAIAGRNALIVWSSAEDIYVSVSHDGGRSWDGPKPALGAHGHYPVAGALADGSFEIGWLEKTPTDPLPNLAKVEVEHVAPTGKTSSIKTIAIDACDCCSPNLSPFLDGGALLAYRTLAADQTRDVHYSRLHHGVWSGSTTISSDGWISPSCPGNGPVVTTDGGRVAAIWYTAADGEARLLTTGSPDAGDRFLMPLRVDGGNSDGMPGITLLHDGASIAFWAEDATGQSKRSLWLRRVTPDYTLQKTAKLGEAPIKSTVRAVESALVSDYAGGTAGATIVVLAIFSDGTQPESFLVTVPESELLAAADPGCHCAPAPSGLVGFPVRGKVASLGRQTVTISHADIAGVLDEGTTECHMRDAERAQLAVGTILLGRIERRAGQWWLYDVRPLGTATHSLN